MIKGIKQWWCGIRGQHEFIETHRDYDEGGSSASYEENLATYTLEVRSEFTNVYGKCTKCDKTKKIGFLGKAPKKITKKDWLL